MTTESTSFNNLLEGKFVFCCPNGGLLVALKLLTWLRTRIMRQVIVFFAKKVIYFLDQFHQFRRLVFRRGLLTECHPAFLVSVGHEALHSTQIVIHPAWRVPGPSVPF